MEVTFRQDGTLGAGRYVTVLLGDRMVGRIFQRGGTYRFVEHQGGVHRFSDRGGGDMQDTDLEHLKAALRARYAPG